MLVERLSPRWSSTGLTPFLGRPGQCGYICATTTGGRLTTTYRFNVQQATYTADLRWNQVSSLLPSGPEVETLLLGHRSHIKCVGRASFRADKGFDLIHKRTQV
ncbi:hypothetical protein AVEN_1425-1 [Araneus ventricosus]|uniref:Uncharacterized protein n=1 Tax=Araneus ventricosus TaxID=182803 RepID=A0A4Y2VJR1_ARAVE|nr:hypothetical protein AVEN_1425-1 [Araneus ventricosus]